MLWGLYLYYFLSSSQTYYKSVILPPHPLLEIFPGQSIGQQAGNSGHEEEVRDSPQAINHVTTFHALGKEEATGSKECWDGISVSKTKLFVWKKRAGQHLHMHQEFMLPIFSLKPRYSVFTESAVRNTRSKTGNPAQLIATPEHTYVHSYLLVEASLRCFSGAYRLGWWGIILSLC